MEMVSHIAALSSHWSRVCHLTFDERRVRPSFARWVRDPFASTERDDGRRMWFAFVRKVCRGQRAYFPRCTWVLREERGALGRYHLHGLIGGSMLPSAMSALWPWGVAEVYAYDPVGNMSAYIAKALGCEVEVARFSGRLDSGLGVTWSYAALRVRNGLQSAASSQGHGGDTVINMGGVDISES